MAYLTARQIKGISDNVFMAARENAAQTVIDEHGGLQAVKAKYGEVDAHPSYGEYYLATLRGILDDSLRSPRSFMDYAPRPLTDAEIKRFEVSLSMPGLKRAGKGVVIYAAD